MRVTIEYFGGIMPRTSPHALGRTYACIAHDVQLRNGRLEPWRELLPFSTCASNARSFYIWGCCPICWPAIVQAAEVSPDWGRFYITGRQQYPEAVCMDDSCTPTYYRLGVPVPVSAPSVAGAEECKRESDARSYVYTYVNAWGDEGAPSPPSNLIMVSDGTSVTVSGLAVPPDGYNIKYINLYRTSTGFQTLSKKEQKPLTDYLYVATLDSAAGSFTDTIKIVALGPVLDTYKVRMPPDGLANIVGIEGVVRLAGSVENRIHMTENFQLHNWPVKYDLHLDSTIIHMGCLDQKLFVSTDTNPYVIDVSSCEDMKCIPVVDVDVPLPDISYQYASSFVMTHHGMIYSSPIGLILIDPSARWHNLTARWFSEEQWQANQPDTVRLGYWEGYLFCVSDAMSFILNIDGDPYFDMKNTELSTISDVPIDMHRDSVGKLFLLQDGVIAAWNTADTFREFSWVSRELTGGPSEPGSSPLGNTWSPVSAKIRSDDTNFTLIIPAVERYGVAYPYREVYTRQVRGEGPFRLPRVGRHISYRIRLRGISAVEFFDMGTAHFTINTGV